MSYRSSGWIYPLVSQPICGHPHRTGTVLHQQSPLGWKPQCHTCYADACQQHQDMTHLKHPHFKTVSQILSNPFKSSQNPSLFIKNIQGFAQDFFDKCWWDLIGFERIWDTVLKWRHFKWVMFWCCWAWGRGPQWDHWASGPFRLNCKLYKPRLNCRLYK